MAEKIIELTMSEAISQISRADEAAAELIVRVDPAGGYEVLKDRMGLEGRRMGREELDRRRAEVDERSVLR